MILALRYLVRFLCWLCPWLLADYRRRIKPRCKCPACGAVKKHTMQWDPVEQLVVLTCVVCRCIWAFKPLASPQKYAKKVEIEEPTP